ncbi:MAG: hypothetical protein ACRDGK_02220 [Actinomycetota bacterium]
MNGKRSERARGAVVGALALGLLLTTAPAARAHHAPGPCDFHRAEGESVRQYARKQIRCAAGRWDVPGGVAVALCIARRESGLIPWAESADGMNKGLFQQHVRYWDANYGTYTRPLWRLRTTILNGRTNAIVSVRMAHTIGWGPWGGRRCD